MTFKGRFFFGLMIFVFLLTPFCIFAEPLLEQKNLEPAPGGTFVLAVPEYAEFAVSTARALAELLQESPYPANIQIIFLEDTASGLDGLFTMPDMLENWVLCFFDAAEAPHKIIIHHGIRGYIAPLEIVSPLPFLLGSHGIPWSFNIRHNEVYKLGIVDGHEALSVIWNEEIHGFALAGAQNGGNPISPETMAKFFIEYSKSLPFPLLNTDRHYSLVAVPGGGIFFISEGLTAFLLLITTGALLLFFLIYSIKYNAVLVFHLKFFYRTLLFFWILLFLLAFSYRINPVLALLSAILITLLPSSIYAKIRFPRGPRFYGFYAVISIFAGLLSATFLDFSFVLVFIWALIFVFLGAYALNPILIFSCAFLLLLPAASFLFNILQAGSTIVTGSWRAAFQISLYLLPIILLVKRGVILFKPTS